jgi:hypothetical protein
MGIFPWGCRSLVTDRCTTGDAYQYVAEFRELTGGRELLELRSVGERGLIA